MSNLEKIKRLSYSSIKLLNENHKEWFDNYINGNKINEYISPLVVGNAFHLVVEHYNKTWTVDSSIGINYIKDRQNEYNYQEDITDDIKLLHTSIENYFYDEPPQAEIAEETIVLTISDIPFMAKLDATHIKDNYIEDYKSVSDFTDITNMKWLEKMTEYYHQAGYYMIAYNYKYGKYPEYVQFTEVRKKSPNLMYSTKDNIIALCVNFNKDDSKLTKEKIIEKYKPRPIGKNIIKIVYNKDLIDIMLKKIDVALYYINILKEDMLQVPFGKDKTIQDLILNK